MTEWISIKDESPEYDWVLVCCYNQHDSPILFAKRYPNGVWQFWDKSGMGPYCGDAFSSMSEESITHWMPLPQLPQDIDAEKRMKDD